MNDHEHTDDANDAQNDDDERSAAEMRADAIERLEDSQGALVVTVSLTDDGEHIEGAAMKYVDEDIDDDDRRALSMALIENALNAASSGGTAIPMTPDGMDGLGTLLSALSGAMDGPDDDGDDGDDGDDDEPAVGGMFA